MITNKPLRLYAVFLVLQLVFTAVCSAETMEVGLEKNSQDGNQIAVESLASLLKGTSGKSQFLLVDARSANSYLQGHIPGALSIYFKDFDKNIGKLPEDKDQLIIYYCDGTS